jgi:hypothetical protein
LVAIVSIATKYGILQHILCVALGGKSSSGRFISRLGEKGLPLYRLLKKHERFSWAVEAQEALD